MSSGWLNVVCCSPELEKVFFQQLDVAVDGQQRSVHHAGIYQRMLLIIDWHWSETALKNSFWNHGPLPLESFQNTFDLQTNTDFYCEHFRNTVFFFRLQHAPVSGHYFDCLPLCGCPTSCVFSTGCMIHNPTEIPGKALVADAAPWTEKNITSLSTGLHICLGAQRRVPSAARQHGAFSTLPTHPSHC